MAGPESMDINIKLAAYFSIFLPTSVRHEYLSNIGLLIEGVLHFKFQGPRP